MDKELDKRFIYKKNNIPEGFIPKLVTISQKTETLAILVPGTYYECIDFRNSLDLLIPESSLFPIIIWFKTGASLPTLIFNGSDLLITDFDLQPNKHYEISIINNRISVVEFNEI